MATIRGRSVSLILRAMTRALRSLCSNGARDPMRHESRSKENLASQHLNDEALRGVRAAELQGGLGEARITLATPTYYSYKRKVQNSNRHTQVCLRSCR
jgi:hypothetical protein